MMNIIISSPTSYKITETTNSSMHNTYFYIAEGVIDSLNLNDVVFSKSSIDNYHCVLIPKEQFDKSNLKLKCFSLQSYDGCIPASTYSCQIAGMEAIITVIFTNGLADEHEPIYVRDRQIGDISTTIVEGDKNSQQFVFYIQRCYDGVSFLDASKQVFFDYIPVDPAYLVDEETGETVAYLSSLAVVEDSNPEPDPNGRDWIRLIWNLPPAATAKQGTVKFAISVQGFLEQGEIIKDYLWQSFPSSFNISANLGVRPVVPVVVPEEIGFVAQLQEQVNSLEEDIRNLEGLDRDGDPDNAEFILGGGGAEEYFAKEE